jgi:hypothetical protein
MPLPIGRNRRRALHWLLILIGILVLAVAGALRAPLPAAVARAPAADGDPYPWLAPCSKLSAHRLLDEAAPAPAPAPPPAAPANPAPPPPRPAPQEDRVGFPAGYGDTFRLLVVFDRPDTKQVEAICANETAAGISPGKAFPYGSVLVVENWRAKLDASGAPVLDANGHYIRQAPLGGVAVMRKEPGFGAAYGPDRSGEWEYAVYRLDGSTIVPPSRTNACASCHLLQAGASTDYVFDMQIYYDWPDSLTPSDLGPDKVNISIYAFYPAVRTVKAGTTVTWVNNDESEHAIASAEGSYASEPLKTRNVKQGDSYSVTFFTPGTYAYSCSIHPAMKGEIVVTE